jgi:hypothetical protein
MDYQIAIPSYRRPNTIKQKTLRLLKRYKVDPKRVTIFVANDDEYRTYKAALAGSPYSKLVIGELGMGAVRNFIHQYYPEHTYLVSFDDDLQRLLRWVDGKTFWDVFCLEREVIEPGFRACERSGARLWGIYAAPNPYYMTPRVSFGLQYIIGSLFGCLNRHDCLVTLDDKEDCERSILFYLADGAVCRLEHITVKTAYYNEPGGMQVERTERRIYESAKYLAEKYPDLCRMYFRTTTGHAELRLRDKRPGRACQKSVDAR